MNDYSVIIERGNVPIKYWLLLQIALMGDADKISSIVNRINKEGKTLIAVYPGVPELMKGIDVSEMELIGGIPDGSLYLK